MTHRCTGCYDCLRPLQHITVAHFPPFESSIDRGSDRENAQRVLTTVVEKQMQDILRLHENDTLGWYGGREITQGTDKNRRGCTHRNYTKYGERFFCRQCGQWMDTEPFRG